MFIPTIQREPAMSELGRIRKGGTRKLKQESNSSERRLGVRKFVTSSRWFVGDGLLTFYECDGRFLDQQRHQRVSCPTEVR